MFQPRIEFPKFHAAHSVQGNHVIVRCTQKKFPVNQNGRRFKRRFLIELLVIRQRPRPISPRHLQLSYIPAVNLLGRGVSRPAGIIPVVWPAGIRSGLRRQQRRKQKQKEEQGSPRSKAEKMFGVHGGTIIAGRLPATKRLGRMGSLQGQTGLPATRKLFQLKTNKTGFGCGSFTSFKHSRTILLATFLTGIPVLIYPSPVLPNRGEKSNEEALLLADDYLS